AIITISSLCRLGTSKSGLHHSLRRHIVIRRSTLTINVDTSITIKEPPERLYRFWRNFENLPHVMSHLDSVRVTAPTRSHWIVKAPAGVRLEWDAEIINDMQTELIAWRSVASADVTHAGSVRFELTARGAGIV